MAGTKEIKRRIKSVKNTKKITKAMELVAASKMKRAVSQTLSSRLYANYSWDLLTSITNKVGDTSHPFFENYVDTDNTNKTNSNRNLIILITSNRGLCGGYNSQIIKKVISVIKKETLSDNIDIITVGKKGDSAMRKIGQNITASFIEMPDINIKINDIIPLSSIIIEEYKKSNYKNIYIGYTDFVSALSQKPKVKKILPISKQEIEEELEEIKLSKEKDVIIDDNTPYLFEGNVHELLESLVEKIIRMQIYQMLLESNASEQSSRMVAMKNANEAAGEMIDDLTLVFNKARQSGITREISEISAGMASVS